MSIISLTTEKRKSQSERTRNISRHVSVINSDSPQSHAYASWQQVPECVKTRNQWLKELRRPVPRARKHGSILLLHEKPIGTKKGTTPFTITEIKALKDRVALGDSLTPYELCRLRSAGQISEPFLFDEDQTEPITELTEEEARKLFWSFLFDGSHDADYIVEVPERGRRTWKKKYSAPSVSKHLCGQPMFGTKKGEKARLLTVDLDRHKGTVKAEHHLSLCLKVGTVLTEKFPELRFAPEINPRNGSVKFFGWLDAWYNIEEAERVAEHIREILQEAIFDHDFSRVEIFPSSCPQVLAPLRRDKIMVIDHPIRQVRSWYQEWASGKKVRRYCEVWSVADYMNWVLFSDTHFDMARFEEVLRTAVTNLPDSEDEDNEREKSSSKSPKKSTHSDGLGSIGSLKGRCAESLVEFWSGKGIPPADTLNIYLVVTLRIFKAEGLSEQDAVDWIENRLELLPDTTFSDRLTDDFGEVMRVARATAQQIWACNGYQPDPETSNAKLRATVDAWRDRGFVLSDAETWENAEPLSKVKVKVSYPVHHLVPLAAILGVGVEKARAFLDALLLHVNTKNELALLYVGKFMEKAGIKGSKNQQKRVDVRQFLKDAGLLILQQRYFCDDATGYRHGDFFICGAAVQFAETCRLKVVVANEDTPGPPVSISYLSDGKETGCLDKDQIAELVLEGRRLACESRFWKKRDCRKAKIRQAAA